MSNLAKLAALHATHLQHIEEEMEQAKADLGEDADKSSIDQIEMQKLSSLIQAEQLFIQTFSNIESTVNRTSGVIGGNFK